eukprot:CAMPEP_0114245626 /NCGR_PEP_ID=MMETSP0058-20121206/12005_1 /TAXON_ID=36894 /ORGANISM="Pyramimonas parkeae, CCMP726" /LENGTH=360 /DNA_ID=CAMNT_0001358709 /DNA_START=365 /DNA_END=1447 /DNA_ORIENTATION=-
MTREVESDSSPSQNSTMDETAWTEPEGDAKPEPRTHHADGAAPTVHGRRPKSAERSTRGTGTGKGKGKSIVVVGNGKSVLGSGLGAKVDEFDEVARFNYYKTKGYESDVGTKTTVWVLAQIKDPADSPPDGRLGKVKKIVVPFSYRHSSCTTVNKPCSLKPEHKLVLKQKIAELKTKYAKAKVDSKTVITTLEEVDILYTKYKLHEKFPSSGLQMLMFFAMNFEKVYYMGFDFHSGGHDHYFEVKMKNYTCHNMRDETRIIQALEAEGRLVNLNPDAGPKVRLPPSLLYKSITKDYDPDCKIICGKENFLPEGKCQKWSAPGGLLPWTKGLSDRDRKAKTNGRKAVQLDGPRIRRQGRSL